MKLTINSLNDRKAYITLKAETGDSNREARKQITENFRDRKPTIEGRSVLVEVLGNISPVVLGTAIRGLIDMRCSIEMYDNEEGHFMRVVGGGK